MAFQAGSVIGSSVRLKLFMWIMAGGTRKPCISFSPAFARDQTVRCRSRAGHPFDSGEFHIPPGAVTRTAEVHRICGTKMTGVEDGRLRLLGSACGIGIHCLDVRRTRSMAGFAGHARHKVEFVETSPDTG